MVAVDETKVARSSDRFRLEKWFRMTHRLRFGVMALSVVIPILAFAFAMAILLNHSHQRVAVRLTGHVAEATAKAIDGNITLHFQALHDLASQLRSTPREEMPKRLDAIGSRYLQAYLGWIGLLVTDTVTRRSVARLGPTNLETPATKVGGQMTDIAAAARGDDIMVGPITKIAGIGHAIWLHAPLKVDGSIPYVVTVVLPISQFAGLLRDHLPSPDWAAAILDEHGQPITHLQPDRYATGSIATLSAGVSGNADLSTNDHRIKTFDGAEHYFVTKQTLAGNAKILIAVPVSDIRALTSQSDLLIGGGTLATILVSAMIFVVTGRMTGRYEERERIRESERRLNEVAENFPGLIFRRVLHPNGSVTYPYISKLGINTGGSLLEPPPPSHSLSHYALHGIHPDDMSAWLDAVDISARTLKPFTVELRVKGQDNQFQWFRSTARPYRADHDCIVWDGVAVDITELKLAEQEQNRLREILEKERRLFEAILEQMPSGLSVAEAPSGRLLLYNARAVDLLKHPLRPMTDPASLQKFGAIHPDGRSYEPDDYPIIRAARCDEAVRHHELTYRRGDGVITTFLVNATPVRDSEGRTVLAVATFDDISERKRLENDLRAAKEQAERADRAKSTFLAAASHDLRQPAQSIWLLADELARRFGSGDAGPLLHALAASAAAMRTLLDGMLDISRLDAGIVKAKPAPLAIGPLLARMGTEYRLEAQEKELELRVMKTDAWAMTDPGLLERILRNLLENALRYTRKGRILIGCRYRGDHLRIDVVDTGIGIPPERIDEIFDEFVQIGNPERDRTKGLGLGLAVVKRLAELLDHTIGVASIPGRGSRFSIELPRVEQPKPKPTTKMSNDKAMKPGTALVIDDEALILMSLRLVLEEWGWTVLTAGSESEALATLNSGKSCPDVIVADYRLREGRTGTEAIHNIRRICEQNIPAILLTGDTSVERIQEAARDGTRLIHKPVDPARLRALLAEAVAT